MIHIFSQQSNHRCSLTWVAYLLILFSEMSSTSWRLKENFLFKVEVLVALATILITIFEPCLVLLFLPRWKTIKYILPLCKGLLCITLGTYSPQSDNFLLRLGNCGAFIFKGLVGCFFVRVVFIKCAKISVCFKR